LTETKTPADGGNGHSDDDFVPITNVLPGTGLRSTSSFSWRYNGI